MTLTIHATKKLLDRVRQPVAATPVSPTTALGNWYATALFWKPQLALLVSERTLLPILMHLAPAATLAARFPTHLAAVLAALDAGKDFIAAELAQMNDMRYAKTANRSLLGVMNQFAFLAQVYRDYDETDELLALSLRLADTPYSPLYKRHHKPDLELNALVNAWLMSSASSPVL